MNKKINLKSTYTIITLLLITSFCQALEYRTVDIRVKGIKPIEDSQVQTPGDIHYTLRLYNQGPDTLFPEDSFYHGLSNRKTQDRSIRTGQRKMALGRSINPGDSADFDFIVLSSVKQNIPNMTFSPAEYTGCYSPKSNTTNPLQDEFWPETGDNGPHFDHTFDLVYTLDAPLLNTQVIKLAPNPAGNKVIILNTHNPVFSLSVKNIKGQEIFLTSSVANEFDLSSLASSIYFIQLWDGDAILRKKLIVQNE